jgi:hypothetical protein
VRKSQKQIYHQGTEHDHNPTIHQQAKAEVNQKKRHISGTSFKHFILEKDVYKQVQSLLTSSQAEHN